MNKIKVFTDNYGKGLFAYFFSILNVLHNLKKDEQVFIDLCGKTMYYDPNFKKTDNVWEYFFEQPFNITKNEAYKNPIEVGSLLEEQYLFCLSNGKYNISYKHDDFQIAQNLIKKYIKFQKDFINEFNEYKKSLFGDNLVFGVHVRSNEHYRTGHASSQFDKVGCDFFFDKIEKKLIEHNKRFNKKYKKLFLATDNEENVEKFKQRYGDIIITNNSLISPKGSARDNCWLFNENNYQKAKDVMYEVLLLKSCDFKLLVNSNVSCAAAVFSDINSFEFVDMHVNFY